VTLIIAWSQPEGIYVATDYRVTDARSGRLIDDAATKHLAVSYPPYDAGPQVLMAYCGLAILPDGTRMGDWLRETLRGDMDETFDRSMAHVNKRVESTGVVYDGPDLSVAS
jgi:hypothetical protein